MIKDTAIFKEEMRKAAICDLEKLIERMCEAIADVPLLGLRVSAAFEQMQLHVQTQIDAMTSVSTAEHLFEGLQNVVNMQAKALAKMTMMLAIHEAIGFEAGYNYAQIEDLGAMAGGSLEGEAKR